MGATKAKKGATPVDKTKDSANKKVAQKKKGDKKGRQRQDGRNNDTKGTKGKSKECANSCDSAYLRSNTGRVVFSRPPIPFLFTLVSPLRGKVEKGRTLLFTLRIIGWGEFIGYTALEILLPNLVMCRTNKISYASTPSNIQQNNPSGKCLNPSA